MPEFVLPSTDHRLTSAAPSTRKRLREPEEHYTGEQDVAQEEMNRLAGEAAALALKADEHPDPVVQVGVARDVADIRNHWDTITERIYAANPSARAIALRSIQVAMIGMLKGSNILVPRGDGVSNFTGDFIVNDEDDMSPEAKKLFDDLMKVHRERHLRPDEQQLAGLGVFVRVNIGVNDTDQGIPFVENLQIGFQKKLLDMVSNTGASISAGNIKSLTECLFKSFGDVGIANMRKLYSQLQAEHTKTAIADDLLEASKANHNADEQSLLKVSSRSMRVHEKQGKTNEMITLEDGIAHFLYITEYRAWAQAYRDENPRAIMVLKDFAFGRPESVVTRYLLAQQKNEEDRKIMEEGGNLKSSTETNAEKEVKRLSTFKEWQKEANAFYTWVTYLGKSSLFLNGDRPFRKLSRIGAKRLEQMLPVFTKDCGVMWHTMRGIGEAIHSDIANGRPLKDIDLKGIKSLDDFRFRFVAAGYDLPSPINPPSVVADRVTDGLVDVDEVCGDEYESYVPANQLDVDMEGQSDAESELSVA